MTIDLTHTTLIDSAVGIGETLLAAARTAIQEKHSLNPSEVYITSIAHSGEHVVNDIEAVINGVTVVLSEATVDLNVVHKILVSFGADSSTATPLVVADGATDSTVAPITGSTSTAPVA